MCTTNCSQNRKALTKSADLSGIERELVAASWTASGFAYMPYSKFPVGAALIAENDAGESKVFTGCNVENASYGGTICAERTAILKAISEGYRKLKTIAVVCAKIPGGSPCGLCRQVIREFGGLDGVVLTVQNREGDVTRWTVDELLPDSFGPDSL